MVYMDIVLLSAVLALSLWCAVSDLKSRLIPAVPLVMIAGLRALWFIPALSTGYEDFSAVCGYLLGAAAAFVLMFVSGLIMKDGVGGGDIKLMTALGFATGLDSLAVLMFFTFLPAALLGTGMLILKKGNLKTGLPLAPFSAFGMLAVCVINTLTVLL